MKYIDRKEPRYRTASAILHCSYLNDYPKNADMFVWGIPRKYEKARDREISAIVTCYIYDGTKASIAAARKVDAMFRGSPFNFIAKGFHCTMMLDKDQDEVVYKEIRTKDLYIFLKGVTYIYKKYGSIYKAYSLSKSDSPLQNITYALNVGDIFSDGSTLSMTRKCMFLFMMCHCFDDYKADSSRLLAPVYDCHIYYARKLGLIDNSSKYDKYVFNEMTDNLKWFSEQHPLTFWVGFVAYVEADRKRDRILKKFATMDIKRHRFKKR